MVSTWSKRKYARTQRSQSDRNLCLSGNVSRAQQVSLWNYVLAISQQPPSSVESARVADFQAHLHKLFAPRDCAHINPESP
jgi:hypothetical protein